MIVGPKFIWLHFPKCGGTETEFVLRKRFGEDPLLRFDPIDPNNIVWHHGVAERRAYDPHFEVAGREIVCGIRRLPHWVLSRTFYEYARSRRAPARAQVLVGTILEADGILSTADDYMTQYSRAGVDRWIRTEHLADDFRAAFAAHLDLARVDFDADFAGRNSQTYIKDPAFYFSPAELRNLYAHNPLWSAFERQVYGGLVEI
ncbi:MAG: hypothetical protein AB7G15_14070 [Alphaproteobacteria bacterium]